jgi:hypothetical protein
MVLSQPKILSSSALVVQIRQIARDRSLYPPSSSKDAKLPGVRCAMPERDVKLIQLSWESLLRVRNCLYRG